MPQTLRLTNSEDPNLIYKCVAGIEPATSRLATGRSIQLSYTVVYKVASQRPSIHGDAEYGTL